MFKLASRWILFLTCLYLASTICTAEDRVIGKWIDTMWGVAKARITIVLDVEEMKYYRISEYDDGSSGRYELRLVKAKTGEKQRFADIKGTDMYVIDPKGNLDLWDDDGFIRECRPAAK